MTGGRLSRHRRRDRRCRRPLNLGTGTADPAELAGGRAGVRDTQRHPEMGGKHVQHPQVGEGRRLQRPLERAQASLPVDERARLLRHRRDRQNDIGDLSYRGPANLQRHAERHRGDRLQRHGRIRQVVDVHPGDDESIELTGSRGGKDGRGVAARPRWDGLAPDGPDLGAGHRVRDRAATRQQRGQHARGEGAPFTGAARYPRQARAGHLREPEDRGEGARRLRGPLPHQDDSPGRSQRATGCPIPGRQARQQRRFPTGGDGQQRPRHLGQPPAGQRRQREDRRPPLGRGLAQPQEDDRRLVLGLQADQQHGGCALEIRMGHPDAGTGNGVGQELLLLRRVRPGAEVHVVGAQDKPGELGVGIGVLAGQPAAGQDADAMTVPAFREPAGRERERLGPGGLDELAGGVVPDQRRAQPVSGAGVGEGEPALVAVPLLVDGRVLSGEPPHHLAAAVVGPQRASVGAVLTGGRGGDQVERPCAEAVGRAGERPHRADLHGVAGEVRVERLTFRDRHLLVRAPLEQLDERVTRDLRGEPGTARAQHAALPVEQDLGGDGQRLRVRPLGFLEPGDGLAVGHGLVLQRALAALVTDRAIQRMVEQQELQRPRLRLGSDGRGELGAHDHVGRHGRRTGGDRLALPLDLDDALPAGPDGVQQRMVAEPWDLDPEELGRTDDQRSLGNADRLAVDGQGDKIRRCGHGRGLRGAARRHGCHSDQ